MGWTSVRVGKAQYLLFRKATRVFNLKLEKVDRFLVTFGWHSNCSMVGQLLSEHG